MYKILAFLLAFATGIIVSGDAAGQADSVKTAVISVRNLHCNNDMPTIKKQLLKQEGIDEVTFTGISNEISTFTIIYHSSATDQRKIEKTIESTPGCDDQSEMPYRVKKEKHSKKSKS